MTESPIECSTKHGYRMGVGTTIIAVPPAPTFAEISSFAFNYGEFAIIECWAGLCIFGRRQW